MRVVKRLCSIGLRRTLIALDQGGVYDVSRIKSVGKDVRLEKLGSIEFADAPIIGRVGIPDPQLGTDWEGRMPFYGKWFDDIGETDAGYHLRRGISSLSTERLLEQIKRDDQYALVGEYKQIFQTIFDVKKHMPMVLISHNYLDLFSFPVVLPSFADEALREKVEIVFKILLKAEAGDDSPPDTSGDAGIVVEES